MPTAPSQSNTFVPEVTDALKVSFSRNEKKFRVNEYAQIVPVDKKVGLYLHMDREEAGRLLSTDGKENNWPDGAARPTHEGEHEEFQFKAYQTDRKDFGFVVGDLAVEQAKFDVIASQAGPKAEQAMRLRTQRVITSATTSGNYDAAHTSAVSSISGVTGKWDVSTTARKDIKRSLDYAVEQIIKSTLNGVNPEDLMLVMSLGCARLVSASQEIIDHIKGSPDAYAEILGELRSKNPNHAFGLPSQLYGVKLVIEDTVKVTSKKGATKAVTYILPDTTPFLCSRVGGLVDERMSEAPSFSTHVLFMKEEMTVEQFRDYQNKHRRVEGHVTEDYGTVMASSISGFLFTAAVA